MKFISLFSGCGGIDLALERAGMECVLQNEKCSLALSVLRKHWPDIKRVTDVRSLRYSRRDQCDLIAGGFPCQDLSVAGKRAGLAGNRSGLWWEFHRIIAAFAPPWVFIENVPGLLSSVGGRDLAAILSGLGQLGYGWAYRVLDAQYDRVAQRRRRVFIVGHSGGRAERAAEILFESSRVPWHSSPSREKGKEVAACLTGGVARCRRDDVNLLVVNTISGHHRWDDAETETFVPVAPMGSLRRGNGNETGSIPCVAHSLRGEGFDASEDDAATLNANANANASWRNTPMICHGWAVRRLMPIECERLQGMPDDWTRYGIHKNGGEVRLSDSARYRLIGNSVAVPCIEWIAKRIAATRN